MVSKQKKIMPLEDHDYRLTVKVNANEIYLWFDRSDGKASPIFVKKKKNPSECTSCFWNANYSFVLHLEDGCRLYRDRRNMDLHIGTLPSDSYYTAIDLTSANFSQRRNHLVKNGTMRRKKKMYRNRNVLHEVLTLNVNLDNVIKDMATTQ